MKYWGIFVLVRKYLVHQSGFFSPDCLDIALHVDSCQQVTNLDWGTLLGLVKVFQFVFAQGESKVKPLLDAQFWKGVLPNNINGDGRDGHAYCLLD